jgi:predicted nucleotidyltransferase component of viral defense system
MIFNSLKNIIENNKNNNPAYTRIILKDQLQNYVLNFIYNNVLYKNLIFTGGTCLRKIYGLSRLSEDLDFDYKQNFNIDKFSNDLTNYFVKKLQFNKIKTKISGNRKTVFVKFPILFDLGLVKEGTGSDVLFVRCDFSKEATGRAKTEINSISSGEFTFFVLSYDLTTLFTNKIAAFLERKFYKGKEQLVSFKGRDLFDVVWFLERSKKSDWNLKPNWTILQKRLGLNNKEEIVKKIIAKVKIIDKQKVYQDLVPFIGNNTTIKNFENYFPEIIIKNISFVL